MTGTQVNLSIDLEGQYCNHWPFAKISVNNQTLFDGEIQNCITFDFTINAKENNYLCIEHYGKRFGENNVYDCIPDQMQDCLLAISDIRFDDITIGYELMSKLVFKTIWTETQLQTMTPDLLQAMSIIPCNSTTTVYNKMNFNSQFMLKFELPILNWLTIAKYKKPNEDVAYFSNHSLRWHYEEDLKLIEEIKKLINQ
jgi:hypothetical protein